MYASKNVTPGASRSGLWLRKVHRSRAALLGLGFIGAIFLVGLTGVLVLTQIDLGGWAADYVSARLNRRVGIESLHLTLRRSLTLDLQGFSLGNAVGGSKPEMAEIGHFAVDLDPWALLRGKLLVRRLQIDRLSVLLEHASDDVANWKFRTPARPTAASGRRGTLPTLLDAGLHSGEVDIRTSSGALIRLVLRDAAVRSAGDDQPVLVSADGAYNDFPATLQARTQSFAVLRDLAVPLATDLRITSGAHVLAFNGTMGDPLNVDGVVGQLSFESPDLGLLLSAFGLPMHADMPAAATAALTRTGDAWHFDTVHGNLAGDAFTGKVDLAEGKRREPDAVSTDIRFNTIDLKQILGRIGSAGPPGKVPEIQEKPGTLVDARLGVAGIRYGAIGITDFASHLTVAPGKVILDDTSFGVAGAKATVSAIADPAKIGSHVTAGAALSGFDVGALRSMLGAGPVGLSGRLDLRLAAESTGTTIMGAIEASRIDGVLSMTNGSVPREIIGLVSVDVARLFSREKGSARVNCLLGAAHLRNLAGSLAPMRLSTSAGTIAGFGQVDLRRDAIDVFIRTERKSTAFSALDIPLHISGHLGSPNVAPVLSASVRARLGAADKVADLPPQLESFARSNPCFRQAQ